MPADELGRHPAGRRRAVHPQRDGTVWEGRALRDDRQHAGFPKGAAIAGPGQNGRWERLVLAVPKSVGILRTGIVAFAAEHGADAGQQGDVALAVSEAMSNAVIHGFIDSSPGELHVIAEHHPGRLVVRVIDDGCGLVPRADSPGLGLGAPLMARLASELVIGPGLDGTGTETRLTFDLSATPAGPGPEQVERQLNQFR
jgi:anti-sigma regulatory factor (Ser/Thr protein kinase)